MQLIVAVDNNWAIGNGNKLLVRIPEDQKFFRDTTMGKVVVLGFSANGRKQGRKYGNCHDL